MFLCGYFRFHWFWPTPPWCAPPPVKISQSPQMNLVGWLLFLVNPVSDDVKRNPHALCPHSPHTHPHTFPCIHVSQFFSSVPEEAGHTPGDSTLVLFSVFISAKKENDSAHSPHQFCCSCFSCKVLFQVPWHCFGGVCCFSDFHSNEFGLLSPCQGKLIELNAVLAIIENNGSVPPPPKMYNCVVAVEQQDSDSVASQCPAVKAAIIFGKALI